jgi:hypothetical protein
LIVSHSITPPWHFTIIASSALDHESLFAFVGLQL